ncbi:hypothetical protein QO002_003276 [Pararhizobium capsulatum DSM 1112]|uniref:Uncharacterized protein n=1 Tax=Pararhizobium capsulatum DSM 1112 TaxID=1121113 RepID=A0ABU0BSA0_9HYPH|nr:hypothetical protein [Pararhizobium capsulatum]MDQ0321138.1 hypothetical protein [Pararhizobium capsulatum DSM 1112]
MAVDFTNWIDEFNKLGVSMPKNRFGKQSRVPWRMVRNGQAEALTLPAFMAYCAVADALRSWNRIDTKAILTLVANEDFYFPIFAEAARHFASQIWKTTVFQSNVFEWSEKPFETKPRPCATRGRYSLRRSATKSKTTTASSAMQWCHLALEQKGMPRPHFGGLDFR